MKAFLKHILLGAGAAAAVLSLVVPAQAETYGKVIQKSVNGSKYSLFVPSSYTPAKKYPLIVALHYSTGSGVAMTSAWREPAEKKGYLVAAPDAANPQYWDIPGEERKVLAMLKDVESDYSVDKKRVYVMGFSAGATFAYYMGLDHPKVFSALAAHAGRYEWIEKNALPKFGKRIPVFILHGKRDAVRDTSYAEYAQRRLSKKGYPTKLLLIDGLDHTYPVAVNWHIVHWLEGLGAGSEATEEEPDEAEQLDKAEPPPLKRGGSLIEFE